MSPSPKKAEFIGSHEHLVTGAFYTVSEYAAINDIPLKTMCSRLLRNYKVTNKMLLPSFSKRKLEISKAKKWQMAIIGWRYFVTKNSL